MFHAMAEEPRGHVEEIRKRDLGLAAISIS